MKKISTKAWKQLFYCEKKFIGEDLKFITDYKPTKDINPHIGVVTPTGYTYELGMDIKKRVTDYERDELSKFFKWLHNSNGKAFVNERMYDYNSNYFVIRGNAFWKKKDNEMHLNINVLAYKNSPKPKVEIKKFDAYSSNAHENHIIKKEGKFEPVLLFCKNGKLSTFF